MARLRANAVAGQISTAGGITAAATAFDSTGLADAPVVASPDTLAVTFYTTDATGRITAKEIAYITAHTAAATTATIVRAQEGTTAQAFAVNTSWAASATTVDFEFILAAVRAVTAADTMTSRDSIVLANGTFTEVLPPVATSVGKRYTIKNVGTGTITIAPASGTIDGAANKTLTVQYSSLDLVTDGTNWFTV